MEKDIDAIDFTNQHQSPNKREKKDGESSIINDQEVDGLLDWAMDLPDVSGDGFKASGSSFFKQGLN